MPEKQPNEENGKEKLPLSKPRFRTLENLHVNLARMLASSFSTLQRSVVDCDIAFVDQTTYAEYIASLSNPCCAYTFTIDPMRGPAILDFQLPVAYTFIDRQMGGTGANPPSLSRPLTSIERTVMGKVVTRSLADLEATWEALVKIRVSDAELETNPEFITAASPSDPVILVAFEVNSQHCSGQVSLCYPYETLAPVAEYLDTGTWAVQKKKAREAQAAQERPPQQQEAVPPPPELVPEVPAPISSDESLEAIAARRPADVAGVVQTLLTQRSGQDADGDLPGKLKAAILLAGLGVDLASKVIQHCPRGYKKRISVALEKLRDVTAQQKNAVFEEARDRLVSGDYTLRESLGRVRDSLRGVLDGGFTMLRNVNPNQIIPFISKEHPQTISLILAQLNANQSAGVLNGLPEEMQSDVAFRIAQMENISSQVLRELEENLAHELQAIMSGQITEVGGPKAVAEILNSTGRSTEKAVLERLDAQDPELAEEVRNQMFVFDDIANLTDREIQLILREVDTKELAVSLKGGSEELQDRIFGNMSEKAATTTKEEMRSSGPVRMSDVEEVQLRIVQMVRQLEEKGQVKIVRGASNDRFV